MDGVHAGTNSADIGTQSITDSYSDLWIGKDHIHSHYLNAYIDEIRISKGIARWVTDFDVPYAPYGLGESSLWAESGGNVYRDTGNVGIGTASPVALFEVHEENHSNGGEIAISNNSNDQLNLYLGGSGRGDGTARNGLIRVVRNDGSPGNLILQGLSGGNVGIGTTNPDCKLYVHGSYGVTFDFNESSFSGRVRFGTLGSRPAMLLDDGTNNYVVRIASTPGMAHYFNNGGNVGIGTMSPSYKLHVAGDAMANHWYTSSDSRLKKNIAPIQDALNKVSILNGVEFEWRTEEYPEKEFNEGKAIGLIAKEVEEVLPEVVTTDEDGYKSVDYVNIVPVLIEAVKELKTQNEQLRSRIEELESSVYEN